MTRKKSSTIGTGDLLTMPEPISIYDVQKNNSSYNTAETPVVMKKNIQTN